MGLFGQFVGSWDLEVLWYLPDGSVRQAPGEWHFGWVLGGWAIQDVWVAPRRGDPTDVGADLGDYGTSLRFYDPALKAWQSTWIGPRRCMVRQFVARAIATEIVLEESHADGVQTRWSFSDIGRDSFRWRNEDREDGARWSLRQEFHATRVRR